MSKQNMKNLILSIFAIVIVTFPFFAEKGLCETGQDVIQVPAMGSAQIGKSDTMTIRSEAVKKALSKSVESALFQIMPPENLATDFKNIESILTSDPSQYVRDYKIIGEETSGKEYRVIISANILKNKLSSVSQTKETESPESYPKVLLLISEKLDSFGQASSWWSGNMLQPSLCEPESVSVLSSKKFSAIDHSKAATDETGKPFTISPAPTNDEAIRLAKAYKADLVIIGQINASDSGNSLSGGIKSFPARAEARILNVATGSEIASAAETASSLNAESTAGTKQAAIQATRQVTAKLAQAAASSWKKPEPAASDEIANGANTIPVIINGQDILGKMIPIRTAMTSIKGMKEVKTLEMNFSNAKLQASYEGDASALARELALKSFENFRMEITPDPESGVIINIPEQKMK